MENDHYDKVISDLRLRITKLENTISVLEQLKAGGLPSVDSGMGGSQVTNDSPAPATGPGAFFGMTIADAAKKLLGGQRRQMSTSEIVPELEKGGVVLTSLDKVNTVGSILLRRFQTTGDIVRVSRGLWGLQEWYPGRRFPGGKNGKQEEQKGEETPQVENIAETEPDGPVAGNADWVGAETPPQEEDDPYDF
jgi:hypothetical protein